MNAASVDPAPADLVSLAVSGSGPVIRLSVAGEIDTTSAPAVAKSLAALLDGGATDLTVDLAGVTFIDSAGVCVLATAHRRAQAQGVRLRVLAATRAVIRPLQITGLWALLGASDATDRTGDVPLAAVPEVTGP